MNLNKLTPLLYTSPLKETTDWYVNVLGFACSDFVPAYGFARVLLNGTDIMVAEAKLHIKFKNHTSPVPFT